MKPPSIGKPRQLLAAFILAAAAGAAQAQRQPYARPDIEQLNAASQALIKAISARDIGAMEKLWAHDPHVTFMGPLSTSIVVGWEGVRKAWAMRFNEFAHVTVSLAESHVRTEGKLAWAVGVEKVRLVRKNGDTLGFDAFVTNVFEHRGGRWLMVSHQATPIFRETR